ncbi:MAG TPA: type II secretion system protein [Candidatus Angelobacter sp.]|jgi:prepilin-type N-terminal cleavage/methylation domain-containing protein|nr:type II secretion system protein [Candidatus Angelobacter sp.]
MPTKSNSRSSGFSLVELIIVVFLLSIVVGGIFSQIERAQVKYHVEDQKMDLTQQERDFIDQFTRDLRQAGYPSPTQYGNRFDLSSQYTAVGVYYISPTQVSMEADVDGDGIVDEITYTFDNSAAPCPCLRRASAPKQDGVMPWNQAAANPTTPYTEVQGLVAVAGQPVFTASDQNGSSVSLATPISLSSGSLTDSTYQLLKTIKNVGITVTTQGNKDPDGRKVIQVTMTGMARLPNN